MSYKRINAEAIPNSKVISQETAKAVIKVGDVVVVGAAVDGNTIDLAVPTTGFSAFHLADNITYPSSLPNTNGPDEETYSVGDLVERLQTRKTYKYHARVYNPSAVTPLVLNLNDNLVISPDVAGKLSVLVPDASTIVGAVKAIVAETGVTVPTEDDALVLIEVV